MKTNLLNSALLFAFLLSTVSFAAAETVHANIPFEFLANGQPMPAGAYTVRSTIGAPSFLLFVNETTGEKAFAFARTTHDVSSKSESSFTLRTAEKSYELSTVPTRKASISLILGK
jgi:hypothetical protein